MAAFDAETGNVEYRFANLPKCAKRAMTGYYFISQLTSINEHEIAYTDSYSGEVFIDDVDTPGEKPVKYNVFDLTDQCIPDIGSTLFYSYEYVSLLRKYYSKEIVDVQFTDTEICCLISHKHSSAYDYSLVRIDRKANHREEYAIPKHNGIFCVGLKKCCKKLIPFVIEKSKKSISAIEYRIEAQL